MNILTSAYLMGAKIIEKHFTSNKKLKGNDHYHSMDVNDLKIFKKTSLYKKNFRNLKIKKFYQR